MRQPVDDEMIDEAEEILRQHSGVDNPITSGELGDRLGIDDAEGNPKARSVITYLIAERGMAIASGSQGSFMIQNEDELMDYVEFLDNRIRGIMDRRQAVMDVYRNEDIDPDDVDL